MKTKIQENQFHVLFVGNNPGELSNYAAILHNHRDVRFITDISFDLKESFNKAMTNSPGYILLDDCFDITPLKKLYGKSGEKIRPGISL